MASRRRETQCETSSPALVGRSIDIPYPAGINNRAQDIWWGFFCWWILSGRWQPSRTAEHCPGKPLGCIALSSSDCMPQGTDMIFISHNYRLGPLGFPQGEEAKREKALNLGIKDHLAALKWVHENIGAFGGDKNKVSAFLNTTRLCYLT